MTPEERSLLDETLAHFTEISRQNRFPENNAIPHDDERCAICHPEKTGMHPFAVYLEVLTPCICIRRPSLDQELVDAINEDLALLGEPADASLEAMDKGDPRALEQWRSWAREALATGLGLLSIHSSTSLDFDLEEMEEEGFGDLVEEKARAIMDHQKSNR